MNRKLFNYVKAAIVAVIAVSMLIAAGTLTYAKSNISLKSSDWMAHAFGKPMDPVPFDDTESEIVAAQNSNGSLSLSAVSQDDFEGTWQPWQFAVKTIDFNLKTDYYLDYDLSVSVKGTGEWKLTLVPGIDDVYDYIVSHADLQEIIFTNAGIADNKTNFNNAKGKIDLRTIPAIKDNAAANGSVSMQIWVQPLSAGGEISGPENNCTITLNSLALSGDGNANETTKPVQTTAPVKTTAPAVTTAPAQTTELAQTQTEAVNTSSQAIETTAAATTQQSQEPTAADSQTGTGTQKGNILLPVIIFIIAAAAIGCGVYFVIKSRKKVG